METAMPNLDSGKNSVRFTQDAAKAVLARLYLNKAVFVDRYASSFNFEAADMQNVISLTSQIIDGGLYALETEDYFSMFDIDNENHKEIIFASRNERNSPPLRGGHSVTRNSTNGMSRGLLLTDTTIGGSYLGGSDAGCTLPEFFDKWNQEDSRFFSQRVPLPSGGIPAGPYFDGNGELLLESVSGVRIGGGDVGTTTLPTVRWTVPKEGKPFINRGFLIGQQFGPYVKDSQTARAYHYVGDSGQDVVFSALLTKGNEIAIHTREVQYDAGSQTTGVRVIKWQIDIANKNRDDTGVDIPVFRLADMYLMRAEAKYRSGDMGGALADVNAVRLARNPDLAGFALTSISIDDILDERGFEFYWEYHRRTDQIRFGKWEDIWESKTSTDVNKRVFPIPPSVVAFNPGIDQNPGY